MKYSLHSNTVCACNQLKWNVSSQRRTVDDIIRCVRTTKPGWCELKANRIYPGWTRLAHVRTRSGLMRVQWTWTVWATSRRLKRTTTRAPVARLSVYSAHIARKTFLMHAHKAHHSWPSFNPLEPTYVCGLAEPGFNPVSQEVGWVQTRNIWVQSGFNPGSRASVDMPIFSMWCQIQFWFEKSLVPPWRNDKSSFQDPCGSEVEHTKVWLLLWDW